MRRLRPEHSSDGVDGHGLAACLETGHAGCRGRDARHLVRRARPRSPQPCGEWCVAWAPPSPTPARRRQPPRRRFRPPPCGPCAGAPEPLQPRHRFRRPRRRPRSPPRDGWSADGQAPEPRPPTHRTSRPRPHWSSPARRSSPALRDESSVDEAKPPRPEPPLPRPPLREPHPAPHRPRLDGDPCPACRQRRQPPSRALAPSAPRGPSVSRSAPPRNGASRRAALEAWPRAPAVPRSTAPSRRHAVPVPADRAAGTGPADRGHGLGR